MQSLINTESTKTPEVGINTPTRYIIKHSNPIKFAQFKISQSLPLKFQTFLSEPTLCCSAIESHGITNLALIPFAMTRGKLKPHLQLSPKGLVPSYNWDSTVTYKTQNSPSKHPMWDLTHARTTHNQIFQSYHVHTIWDIT